MNCYQHEDRPAIAVCRNCGKATCTECCIDSSFGIACCSGCADNLTQSHELTERLKQSFGIGRKPPLPATIPTYGLFGLILLVVGVYLSVTRPGIDFLTLAMAAVFFVMAASSYKRYRDICQTC